MKTNQIYQPLEKEDMTLKELIKIMEKTPITLKMQITKVRGSFKSLENFHKFLQPFHDCLRKQLSQMDSEREEKWMMMMIDDENLGKVAQNDFDFSLK